MSYQSQKPQTSEEKLCCVCLDIGSEPDQIVGCKHPLCRSCASELNDITCPVCHEPLRYVDDYVYAQIMEKQMQDDEEIQSMSSNPEQDESYWYSG